MSSYRQILYHIVFRTKDSQPTIDPDHKVDLFKYVWGIIKNKDGELFRINAMAEHIHILSDLHPSVALADYIKDIKVATSKWMKESGFFPKFKGWAVGYCALTYSYKERNTIINYIKNQEEHHKHESFHDEIRRFLNEHGIKIEEKWFWGNKREGENNNEQE
jgi:REP element-mobilizing transposase RayT